MLIQRPSFARTDAMKDLRLSERLFVIDIFQRESLQFPRRRCQRDHIVVDGFVLQIEMVLVTQPFEPTAIHHRNGDRILTDRHSRKSMRRREVSGIKINLLAQRLRIEVEKGHAAKIDQSRLKPRRLVVHDQKFVIVIAGFGELICPAGVVYPQARQGFIEDDVIVSIERMQRGRAGGQSQCDPKDNKDFQDVPHFSLILSGRSNLSKKRPASDSDFLSLEFHRRAIFFAARRAVLLIGSMFAAASISEKPIASSARGQAARSLKRSCCRRMTPIPRNSRPVTKKFFICLATLPKTNKQATNGRKTSKKRVSSLRLLSVGDRSHRFEAASPSSRSGVITCPGMKKRKDLATHLV